MNYLKLALRARNVQTGVNSRLEQKKTRWVESNRENTNEVDADPPVSEVDYGGSESS